MRLVAATRRKLGDAFLDGLDGRSGGNGRRGSHTRAGGHAKSLRRRCATGNCERNCESCLVHYLRKPQCWQVIPTTLITRVFGAPEAEDHSFEQFVYGHVSRLVLDNYDFSSIKRVVQVGAHHSLLMTQLLMRHPDLEGVLFDSPPAIASARRFTRFAGVADRCTIVTGQRAGQRTGWRRRVHLFARDRELGRHRELAHPGQLPTRDAEGRSTAIDRADADAARHNRGPRREWASADGGAVRSAAGSRGADAERRDPHAVIAAHPGGATRRSPSGGTRGRLGGQPCRNVPFIDFSAALLGQTVAEVRPTATRAEKRLVGRTSSGTAGASISSNRHCAAQEENEMPREIEHHVPTTSLSRRRLLQRTLGIGVAAFALPLLAACGTTATSGPAPTTAPAPAPTLAPESPAQRRPRPRQPRRTTT